MEEQPPRPPADVEPQPAVLRRAPWQAVRRPRRERQHTPPVPAQGPYETSYSIVAGYPEREIVIR